MEVYRISAADFIDDISGEGSKLSGARWNYKGTAVLYTSSSIALATLEMLVRIPIRFSIPDLVIAHIKVPDDSVFNVEVKSLPRKWNQDPSPDALKKITEKWISNAKFLLMRVPSAVVPQNYNYIINPAHSRFNEVKIIKKEPFTFDKRILSKINPDSDVA